MSFTDWLNGQDCPFCLNRFDYGEEIAFFLPCYRHLVHGRCYATYLATLNHGVHPRCYSCRLDILDIIRLKFMPLPQYNPLPMEQRSMVNINLDGRLLRRRDLSNVWSCCEYPLIDVGDLFNDESDLISDIVCIHPCGHPMHARCFFGYEAAYR